MWCMRNKRCQVRQEAAGGRFGRLDKEHFPGPVITRARRFQVPFFDVPLIGIRTSPGAGAPHDRIA
ncbi:hypothetical protein PSAB6_540024 [Paraburkholderia sabiae]|nr:hypothetical protein PSAB6_540024 [Paraburkholderia sabiae]